MARLWSVLLALPLLLFAVGCGSGALPVAAAPASPPPAPTLARDAKAPFSGHGWNPEARADHLVGSIAGSLGVVQHRADEARSRRDAVRLACVAGKLGELARVEREARERRSSIRMAALEGGGADSLLGLLGGLESRARQLRAEAADCTGDEVYASNGFQDTDGVPDRDADGIVDSKDEAEPELLAGEREGRFRSLDRRTEEMREQILRSKARLGLLKETVLAGSAGGLAGKAASIPPAQVAAAQPLPAPPAAQQHDPSMLIRTAEIALAVFEVEKHAGEVEKTASRLGGYLALRSDREITVRVPREKFEELVGTIEKMGDVLHKNVVAEDVTDQYVDLDMRLRNALSVRDRLEKLLAGATVKDAVEIHKELAKVTEEIERYEGKLKLLRDRIAYSTVTVSFERQQTQPVRSQALLPFPWMSTMGLSPLLRVPR